MINYQGRLTDTSGKTVTGTYIFTFRLYDAATSGTKQWQEEQTVTLSSSDNGVFNVVLGATTVLTTVDFNSPLWISVQVGNDAEMTPRQRLTAVGYAMNADQLDGLDSTKFMRTDVDSSTSGKLTITRSGAALLVKPTTDPDANTKMIDVENAAGTTEFSVDSEGDVTVVGNLTVSGTISGSTSTTGTSSTSWTVGSGTSASSSNISVLFGQSSGQKSIAFKGASTGDFTFSDPIRLGTQSALRLEGSTAGSTYVALKAPSSISSSVTWTLPSADGSANQILATDGSGTLSWVTASGLSGIGDVTDIGDCASGACFSSSGSGTALTFRNATSGTVALQTVSGALGSRTISLPATTGTVITSGNLTDITTTGTITSGTWQGTAVGVLYGGTGASTAATARSNLSAAASGANSDITSLSGLTTALPVSEGGTGATSASSARSNLSAAASGANSDITSLTGLTTPLPLSEGGTNSSTLTNCSSGQALTVTSGAVACTSTITASGVSANTLDFTEFKDTMALDANLTLNQTTYTWTQSYTGTSGTGLTYNANSLTSGTAASLASTSTAGTGSSSSKLLNLSRSGANSNASHTAYGLYSAVTDTGTTSTNVAGYFSASGASTNYALQGTGIDLFTLGASDYVQIDGSTTANTTTGGILDINDSSSTTNHRSLDLSTTFTNTAAATSYSLVDAWSSSAVVAGAGVSQTAYGNYTTATKTGADTATGTYTLYGVYGSASNTGATDAGTKNTYGGYFSATGDTAGTATAVGLYTTASGADNNYAAIFNAGNVGVNTTSPGSALDVKGTLRLSGSTSGYVGLTPAAAAGSTTYTLPSADGSSSQFLQTNGLGTLSWATPSGVAPGGSAGGDLSGTYPSPTVAKINGVALGSTTATSGNVLIADGTSWVTKALSGDITVTSGGVTAIGSSKVTNAMLAGSIAASKLVGTDIATVGTITSGTWNGTAIGTSYGGTGQSTTATSGRYLKGDGTNWGTSTGSAAGTGSCTNQFVTATNSDAAPTCTAATLASAQFVSQGTTTTLLHGSAAGNPSWAAVTLTSDVTGTLPIANGGTNNSSAYTTGSVIFSNGTSLTQNNSNLYWDNTNTRLGLGTTSPQTLLDVRGDVLTPTGSYLSPYGGIGRYQNLLTYSEQMDNAAWVKTNVAAVTADGITAPNGTATAEALAPASAAATNVKNTSGTAAVASTAYSCSVWGKVPSSTKSVVLTIGDTATNATATVTFTTTWQRFSVSYTASGTPSGNVFCQIGDASWTTGTLHVWGAQLEQSATAGVYVRAGASTVAASQGAVTDGVATGTTSGTVTSVSVTTANGVSGTVATASTTPAITLTLGAITPTTVNKVTLTAPATGATLTIADGKTLTASNSLTLAGTDGTTMTFPGTSDTVVTLGAAQTLTSKTLTSPTLTTPSLGVATATSINKVALTAPATSATLTIADGKTLTASNSLTLAGTDGTTMTFPGSSDTVVTLAATQTLTNKTLTTPTLSGGTTTVSGGANPGTVLNVSGSVTTSAATNYGIKSSLEHTGGTVNNAFEYGVYSEAKASNTVSGGFAAPLVYGVYGLGTSNTPSGVTQSTANGVYGLAQNINAGTLAFAVGLRAGPVTNSGGGAITYSYGTLIDNQGASGVTTAYGLYVANQTGAGTNYALYQTGTGGTNILNANTRIGSTTAPSNALDVTGNVTISGTTTMSGALSYSSSGQPKRTIVLTAAGAIVGPSSGFADQRRRDGTNFSFYGLEYGRGSPTAKSAYWQFVVPDSYTGTTADVTLFWIPCADANLTTCVTTDPAITGQNAAWQVALDGKDVGNASGFDSALTATAVSTSASGTTQGVLKSLAFSGATTGWASGEVAAVKVTRVATDAGDTFTQTAKLVMVKIEWTASAESD